jgi:hypothetical protein
MVEDHPTTGASDSPTIETGETCRGLTQAILRRLVRARNPGEALKALRENAPIVASQVIGAMGEQGRKASQQQLAGSLMVGSSLLYWAGWMTAPLWVPTLGAAIGTLGAVGVVAGFKWWQDSHRNYEFLKVYYSFLLMMEMADGVISPEERRHLEDFLVSWPLSQAQRQELLDLKVPEVETFEVPSWLEASHREVILAGCYSLASCDGVAEVEETLYAKMAVRLGVPSERLMAIRTQVESLVEETEDILGAIGVGAVVLLHSTDEKQRRAIVSLLAQVNSRSRGEERFWETLHLGNDTEIPAKFKEKSQDLDTILAGSYLLARGIIGITGGDPSALGRGFPLRCQTFGRGSQAPALQRELDASFDLLKAEIEKR